ncbi:MAG: GyrI-like domain-containing protein, partial [Clostridium sp.]
LEKGIYIMAFMDKIQVKLVNTEDINIISSRQIMSTEEYGKYIGKLFETAARNKLTVTGAPMSIYYDEEFNHEANDTEVALPIKEKTEYTKILKGSRCAMTVIKGGYDKLSEGYTKITEWIAANNYRINGAPYEKYVSGPMDRGEIITEIYMPVE